MISHRPPALAIVALAGQWVLAAWVLGSGVVDGQGAEQNPRWQALRARLTNAHALSDASAYAVESWQTEQGLPRNDVMALTFSHEGYLWCGTAYGLARFDGLQFTVFNPANTPGMAQGRITTLLNDRKGRLWLGTDLGEVGYFQDGRMRPVGGRNRGEINRIEEDGDGHIWIGAGNGLGRVEGDALVIPVGPWNQAKPVRRLLFDPVERALWFDQDGVVSVLRQGQHIEVGRLPQGERWGVNTFALSPQGGIWIVDMAHRIGRTDGFASFAGLEPLPMPAPDWVAPMLEGVDGNLWITVGGLGLYRLGMDGGYERFSTERGLNDNRVSCLLDDGRGGVWVGTHHGGLHHIKPRVVRLFDATDGLPTGAVFSVTSNGDGNVYAASREGVVSVVRGGKATPIPLTHPAQTLFLQRSGRLWLSWFGARLSALDPRQNGWDRVESTEVELFNRCTAMVEDLEGRMWLGGHFGLGTYFKGRFQQWNQPGQIPAAWVRALTVAPDGTVWIGLFDGGLYSHKAGVFLRHDEGWDARTWTIQALHADAEGVVWIGTAGEGLIRYDGTRFTRYTKAHGLADEAIAGMLEDGNGNLWISSLRGVFRVSRAELNRHAAGGLPMVRSVSYAARDGLATAGSNPDAQPNTARTADGRLWFATNKGLAMVDPENLDAGTNAPPVVIEELVMDDAVRHLGSSEGGSTSPILIPAGTQRVEIHYTGVSFAAPEQVQFRYRMEGYEPSFVPAGTRRTAYYTRTPPGQYRFQVRASNENGVWNDKGAEIWLRFEPHFWQTWWFGSIAALAGMGVTVVAVRHVSLRKVRRQLALSQYQRALEDERARIAQDLHDHLGAHLARISLMSEIARTAPRDEARLEAHFEGIRAVTRNLTREVDQVVWAVNPARDTVEDLASYCCSHAEEFFALTPIACRVDLPDDLPALRCSSRVRYQFVSVVKEALTNVAKHAEASEVWMRWRFVDSRLTLEIEDNGRGFDAASVNGGRNGLAGMRSRLSMLGGQFDLQSQPGSGTRLRLDLPLAESNDPSARGMEHRRDGGRAE